MNHFRKLIIFIGLILLSQFQPVKRKIPTCAENLQPCWNYWLLNRLQQKPLTGRLNWPLNWPPAKVAAANEIWPNSLAITLPGQRHSISDPQVW